MNIDLRKMTLQELMDAAVKEAWQDGYRQALRDARSCIPPVTYFNAFDGKIEWHKAVSCALEHCRTQIGRQEIPEPPDRSAAA